MKPEVIITTIFYVVAGGAMLLVTFMSWRADRERKKNAAIWKRREDEIHALQVKFMEAAIRSQEPKDPW